MARSETDCDSLKVSDWFKRQGFGKGKAAPKVGTDTQIYIDSTICLAYYFANRKRGQDKYDTGLDSKKFNRRAVSVCAYNSTSAYGRRGISKGLRRELENQMSYLLLREAVDCGREPETEFKETPYTSLAEAVVRDIESGDSDPVNGIHLRLDCPGYDVHRPLGLSEGQTPDLFRTVRENLSNFNFGMMSNLYRQLMFDDMPKLKLDRFSRTVLNKSGVCPSESPSGLWTS